MSKNLVKKILKNNASWTAPAGVNNISISVIACRGITARASGGFTSAITVDGNAFSWGAASDGKLGNGTTTPNQTTPSLILGGYKWINIGAGGTHAAGITSDGDAYCWGEATSGRLGNGTTTPSQTTPSLVLGGYKWLGISAGSSHSAGIISNGDAYCWGAATEGKLGNGTTTPNQTTPSLVLGGHKWVSISAGGSFTSAITIDGDAYCWGAAANGRLGNGTTTPDQTTPSLVLGGHKWVSISAGSSFAAGIISNGDAYCWGTANNGQIGNGTTTPDQNTPSLVLGGYKWIAISAGGTHAAGITSDGDAYCWGEATNGRLGNGTTTPDQTTPSLVLGGHKWVSISAGDTFTLGITVNGDAYSWGQSSTGRLGNGTTTPDQTTPSLVLGGYRWTSVNRTTVVQRTLNVIPGQSYVSNTLPWNVCFGPFTMYQDSPGGYWVELELEYMA